jgi:ubiquitin-conjugating enzyme E2 O
MFNMQDLTNSDGRKENCENNLECSSFFLPRAAFELFSSIKSNIFQTFGGNSISGAFSSVPTFEKDNESDFVDKKDAETCNLCIEPHPTTEFHSANEKTSYPEVIRIDGKNDFPISVDSNNSNWFKQFDVIESFSDHHFFDEGKGLSTSQVSYRS